MTYGQAKRRRDRRRLGWDAVEHIGRLRGIERKADGKSREDREREFYERLKAAWGIK